MPEHGDVGGAQLMPRQITLAADVEGEKSTAGLSGDIDHHHLITTGRGPVVGRERSATHRGRTIFCNYLV